MRRYLLPVVMNLAIPGPGLMLLGRPWLGLGIALWFGLGAELAAFGFLVAPNTVPPFVRVGGLVLAAMAWLLGQGLLVARIRFLRDPNTPRELAILRRFAERALLRGDHKAVRAALLIARSIDDSDLPTRILWARLLSAVARPSRARRAWLHAARLDTGGRFKADIEDGLSRPKPT